MLIALVMILGASDPPKNCHSTSACSSHSKKQHRGYRVAPNVGVIFAPDPLSLFDFPPNYAWTTPFGGYTVYPGQPGSGYGTRSNYSHVNWSVTPEQTAALVKLRLAKLGVPPPPPEPMFLGKNPSVTDDVRLPYPRPKTLPAPR